jgi:hypothetical protein
MAPSPTRVSSVARGLGRLAPLIAAALFLGCAENQRPLEWRDGGPEPAWGSVCSTAVVASGYDTVAVDTGSLARLLVGRIERAGAIHWACAALRWDLSTLPEGEVTEAKLTLGFGRPDLPDPGSAESLDVVLCPAVESWTESALASDGLPAPGLGVVLARETLDAQASVFTAHPDTILVRAGLFADDDFADLVSDWLADPEDNHGVVLRASTVTVDPAVVLRLVAREGTPPPQLEIRMRPAGGADTTVWLSAVADAWLFTTDGPAAPLPVSHLLVSSGRVHRATLRIDPLRLLGVSELPEPPANSVLRAVLRLHLIPGEDWSLRPGKTLRIQLVETAADSSLQGLVSEVTVRGDDATVDLPVATHLRRLIEGRELGLVLRCGSEADSVASVLFRGHDAPDGRPEIEAVFVAPDPRYGR